MGYKYGTLKRGRDYGLKLRSDEDGSSALLNSLFVCAHDKEVCAKCVGLNKCEHDCQDCLDEAVGQLGLFAGGK